MRKIIKWIIRLVFIIGVLYWIHIMAVDETVATRGFWNIQFLYSLFAMYVGVILFAFYGLYNLIKNMINKIRGL